MIQLKRGFIVMLLRNIQTPEGHCIGTGYVLQDISQRLLHLIFAHEKEKWKIFLLSRISCQGGNHLFPIAGFSKIHFQICLGFGITTYKSYGQYFGCRVVLNLTDHCFTHDPLFLGISRTRIPETSQR